MEGLDFRVLDALGRPVDALVSLWKGAAAGGGSAASTPAGDEVFDNRYTDAQGLAHFQVSPTTAGFLYVAVRDTAGNAVADSIPVGAASGVPDSRDAVHAFRALPSVTHGDVHWVFGAPVESPGEVSVFAIDGRQVATLPVPTGSMDVDWRETDAGRRPVASGVYIARFQSPTWSATARVLLLR
jgi:hypothetical protein